MFEVSELGKDQNEANPEVRVLIPYTSKGKAALILHRSSVSCLLDYRTSRTFQSCFRMVTL